MRDALGWPQSALVLGGASDIAMATLTELVPRRCSRVVLAGRSRRRMEDAAGELTKLGAHSVAVEDFDCLDFSSHSEVVSRIFDRWGDIDVVIAAAGLLGDQHADERDPSAAAVVIETNFTGMASALLAVAARLRAQGHGSIVVLSSVAGERARRDNFIYGSSKAGLDAFSQGLSDSLVGTGVDVLIVRPGFVRTRMTEGRQAAPMSTTPEAVAKVIVGALEHRSSAVWAPRSLRVPMTVLRHLPRGLWRRVRT